MARPFWMGRFRFTGLLGMKMLEISDDKFFVETRNKRELEE
jgi:hypothetical protein